MAINRLRCYDIGRRTAASTSKSSANDKSCHEKDMLVVLPDNEKKRSKIAQFSNVSPF